MFSEGRELGESSDKTGQGAFSEATGLGVLRGSRARGVFGGSTVGSIIRGSRALGVAGVLSGLVKISNFLHLFLIIFHVLG